MEESSDPLYGLVVYPLWIFLAKAEGLYDADHPKIWHRTTDEATALFHWATLSAAATSSTSALPDETITVEAAGTSGSPPSWAPSYTEPLPGPPGARS